MAVRHILSKARVAKKSRAKYYKHPDRPGEGAKKRKHLRGQPKVAVVMGEFKRKTLRSRSGEKVTDPAQAKAIAMSEAGLSKDKK